MFKLKYNALSLAQILFGFLNSILLLKVFGVSGQTDAYFIGDVILGGTVMVQMMAVEQFMYSYHELKAASRESAFALYGYALWLILASGTAALVLLNLLSGPVIGLFAYKLDAERVAILKRLFPVFSLLAVFNPLNFLNAKLLNAEGRFAYPYLLGIIPSLLSACALLLVYFSGGSDIIWLLYASVAGAGVSALLGLAAVKGCGIPVRVRTSHPEGRKFVLSSVKIKFGHNINNVLAPLITNNLLAGFSHGAVSYFGYAWKIVTAMGNLATGPSARMFATAVSSAWPGKDPAGIKALLREFLILMTPLFIFSAAAVYAALPLAFRAISSTHMEAADISAIRAMFLALSAWYLIGILESAFVQVCIASNRSSVFIVNNTVFVVSYFSAAWALGRFSGIYSIPFGLMIAQAISLALYYRAYSGILDGLSGAAKAGAS